MELINQTEESILEAAERLFFVKGKNGASMQDIADEAKITRTSLNYYFRSKDKLFEAVFKKTMEQFVPQISELMSSELSAEEYLPAVVDLIIDSMIEKPHIPVFVLQELSSNPERIPRLYEELGIHPEKFFSKMNKDNTLSKLNIDPRQLIINILSMCIFPFAAKPIILTLMYDKNEQAYIDDMKQRKVIIPMIIQNMIKSNLT